MNESAMILTAFENRLRAGLVKHTVAVTCLVYALLRRCVVFIFPYLFLEYIDDFL